jgi:hypothetical protein
MSYAQIVVVVVTETAQTLPQQPDDPKYVPQLYQYQICLTIPN